jgi:hypothetical protein
MLHGVEPGNSVRGSEAFSGENMRKLAILLAALMATGCTTVTVTPESAQAPTQTYGAVDLTSVKVSDSEFAYLGPFFQKAFIRRLGELNGFSNVSDGPADPNATKTKMIYVDATLTKVDKGDAALRWLVGMGAGREHVTAQVHLTDASGKAIGEFKVRKAYSGGAGIGGAGFLDIEDLTQQVGEQCAQTLVDWSQGKITTQAAN